MHHAHPIVLLAGILHHNSKWGYVTHCTALLFELVICTVLKTMGAHNRPVKLDVLIIRTLLVVAHHSGFMVSLKFVIQDGDSN